MKFNWAIYAKLKGVKLGLSHEDDVDGIVSGALFLRKFPSSILVLAQPYDIEKRIFCWYNWVMWDYVADLPCPLKVRMYVDHHKTNFPRNVEISYYDPQAPSAASLAIIALRLEDDYISKKLVQIANDADTGTFSFEESILLNDAIKGANYYGKLYIVRKMSEVGLNVLKDENVKKWMLINQKRREITSIIAKQIEVNPVLVVEFEKRLDIPYRDLCIKLERKGANELCVIIVPKNRKWRVYLGASKESKYDCSAIATELGGGGHKSAAGALIKDKQRIYNSLKRFLNVSELNIILVKDLKNFKSFKV